jgi:hypothetical protein
LVAQDGPEAGHDYPAFAPQFLDYYHGKGVESFVLLL